MSKQDRNCQVSTPEKYMEQMLDYVGYKQDLLRMRYSVNRATGLQGLRQAFQPFMSQCLLMTKREFMRLACPHLSYNGESWP